MSKLIVAVKPPVVHDVKVHKCRRKGVVYELRQLRDGRVREVFNGRVTTYWPAD